MYGHKPHHYISHYKCIYIYTYICIPYGVKLSHVTIGPHIFTVWLFNVAMENHHFWQVNHDKSSINGPFSIAMLNSQRIFPINIPILVGEISVNHYKIQKNTIKSPKKKTYKFTTCRPPFHTSRATALGLSILRRRLQQWPPLEGVVKALLTRYK